MNEQYRELYKKIEPGKIKLPWRWQREPQPETWSEYLASLTWDYFFTGTFRLERSVNGARRTTQRFFKGWPTLSLGIIFIETGDLYGRIHIHGLLRFNEKYRPPAVDIWAAWDRINGFATVEAPRSNEDVSAYCAKYCTKHQKDETYIII